MCQCQFQFAYDRSILLLVTFLYRTKTRCILSSRSYICRRAGSTYPPVMSAPWTPPLLFQELRSDFVFLSFNISFSHPLPLLTGWPDKHGCVFLVHCKGDCSLPKRHFLQCIRKTRPCLNGHSVGTHTSASLDNFRKNFKQGKKFLLIILYYLHMSLFNNWFFVLKILNYKTLK